MATEGVVYIVRNVAAAVKLDQEVALKKAATTEKMQDAATELALIPREVITPQTR